MLVARVSAFEALRAHAAPMGDTPARGPLKTHTARLSPPGQGRGTLHRRTKRPRAIRPIRAVPATGPRPTAPALSGPAAVGRCGGAGPLFAQHDGANDAAVGHELKAPGKVAVHPDGLDRAVDVGRQAARARERGSGGGGTRKADCDAKAARIGRCAPTARMRRGRAAAALEGCVT